MAAYTSRVWSLFVSKQSRFSSLSLFQFKSECKLQNNYPSYYIGRSSHGFARFSLKNIAKDNGRLVKACSIIGIGGVLWWMIEPIFGHSRNDEFTGYDISKKGASDAGKFHLCLYQYTTCPFCCKVRAYLDYAGIPYEIVEVNPVLRQQIKFSKYKKVPILIANGVKEDPIQINDSSVIISALATYAIDPQQRLDDILSYYDPVTYTAEKGKDVTEVPNKYFLMYLENENILKSDVEIDEERRWRKWADEHLVHMLSPNVYRTTKEALQAFRYFSEVGKWEENFPAWERYLVIYVGAAAMYLVGKRLKKRHNLKDDVRESLYDACNEWMKAIGPNKNFLGGEKPNLADLAVYGVLSSIEGCDAFQDLLKNTKTGPWYQRMQSAVNNHLGSKN